MAIKSPAPTDQESTTTETEIVVMPTGRATTPTTQTLTPSTSEIESHNQPISSVETIATTPRIDDNSADTTIASEDDIEMEVPDRNTSKWIVMIVVLLLLIFALAGGIIYYVTQFKGQEEAGPLISPLADSPIATPTPTAVPDPQTTQLEKVGTDDSVDAIKKDIDATDLKDLDKELDEIDGMISQ